jgi:hypothetical protein
LISAVGAFFITFFLTHRPPQLTASPSGPQGATLAVPPDIPVQPDKITKPKKINRQKPVCLMRFISSYFPTAM